MVDMVGTYGENMKVGDLVWFYDPSYINSYGGKHPRELAIIRRINPDGVSIKYYLTMVKTGYRRWTLPEYLELVEVK